MKAYFRQAIAGLITLSLTVLPPPASALFGVGDIVFDPSNYSENVLTAARALKSNLNEAQQLYNQAVQLANEARNLARFPVDYWDRIRTNYEQLKALAQGNASIGEYLQRVNNQFNAIYPGYQVAESYTDSFKTWTGNTLKLANQVFNATESQRKLFESTTDRTQAIVANSVTGEGLTQQIQSQVALSAEMVSELQKIQQLQGEQATLQAAYIAGQVQDQAAEKAAIKRWLDSDKGYKSKM